MGEMSVEANSEQDFGLSPALIAPRPSPASRCVFIRFINTSSNRNS